MSQQYDNNRRGVLFKNEDKRDGKQDADYRGNCEIDGVQYWLDAWINTSKDGKKKFMSLKFNPKMAAEHRTGAPPKKAPAPEPPFEDDMIPF